MTDTINITPICEGIISLIITVLSIVVIPKIKVWLANKLTVSQIDIIKIIVTSAVKAAEQIYSQANKAGSDKKKYVLEYVQNKLAELGMSIDTKEIEIYLEQAVLELKKNTEIDCKPEISE